MPKVSIITPVYNVEKYLDKSIDSILAQTFTDFELLLVNDQSQDESGKVCELWAQKDDRIRVIHKENGGVSSARNCGLDAAKGEFISFIDSDDYVEPNMLETLYNGMIEHDAEVSVCGVYNVYDNTMRPQCSECKEFVCDGVTAYGKLLEGSDIPAALWNKMYRREVIGDLRFPLGKIYEDAFFFADFLPRAEKVWVTTKPLYYYVHRKKSLTTETFNESALNAIEAYEYNLQMIKEKYPQLIKQAEFRLLWAYFVVLDRLLVVKNYKKLSEYGRVKNFLKKNWMKVLESPYFTKGRKIGAVCLKIHVGLYRMVLIAKQRKEQLYD